MKLLNKILSNGRLLVLPVLIWMICQILTKSIAGTNVVNGMADLKALMRSLLSVFCFCLALNCNMLSGRMDLSVGAQMYMGCIFGGNVALSLGLGGIGVLLLSMLVGGICGLLVGFLFINLRIFPMVLGLGMTLIFECFSYSAYRQQGLILFGKPGTSTLSNISFIVCTAAVILVALTVLFQHTSFGYARRAIQGSQKLAADAGINIFSNCLWCYFLAGILVSAAGIFDTAYTGTLTPVMGMSSNGLVFRNMFPLFLGITLGNLGQYRTEKRKRSQIVI